MRKSTPVESNVKGARKSRRPTTPARHSENARAAGAPEPSAAQRQAAVDDAPPARRRNRRGEGGRLREEILTAAVSLAGTLGSIEALSLRAVAREAGITPMSIYAHFETKEELVWALIESEFASLAQQLDRAQADQKDPVARLRARCLTYVRFGLENPGNFLVLFGTAGRPTPPEGTPEQLPGWPLFAGFVSAIQACVSARRAPEVDPRAGATRLWAALHGITVLRVSKKGFPWPPIDQLVDELITDLVLDSALLTTTKRPSTPAH
jgi:AcrR family transcriptional regulator